MENIIEIKDLFFRFEDEETDDMVISDVSLQFEKGTFNVILGHNGSGKSTLAKLMNGLLKPTSGKVTVEGMDTADESAQLDIKRTVGMVFQNPDNQIVASVVEEDVAFGPENLGVEPELIKERVKNALDAVGMSEYRKSSPNNLSGGQKQRVAIAGVIAMQPKCIILDESTAMLDPKGRKEVINTVYKLNREQGITVILITHFMDEAEKADRVLVINDGKIVADGSPKNIFANFEFLKSCGLDIPQTTKLLYELNKAGFKNNTDVISLEETVKIIDELLK